MIIKRFSSKKTNKIETNVLPEQIVAQDSTLDVVEQNIVTTKENNENIEVIEEPPKSDDIFEGFDFDKIVYNQRAERRRGDRRRGFRRIDDRNLISRAQQEAISIKEQASKEGFDKGLEKANETIDSLRDAIEDFFEYKDVMYEQISGDILDISLKIAEKIIKKEVETSKDVLDSMIHDALKSLAKGENKIILKVNPTDVEYTKEIVPKLLSSGQFEAKIFVVGNKDVEEGSVVIETSNGIIDANISTQLELIKEAFKQV